MNAIVPELKHAPSEFKGGATRLAFVVNKWRGANEDRARMMCPLYFYEFQTRCTECDHVSSHFSQLINDPFPPFVCYLDNVYNADVCVLLCGGVC